MEDKTLMEGDIIDLTDLLEEGRPPSGPQQDKTRKKKVNEPDSFDLGKEISMDYDVSVEEIEHDSNVLDDGTAFDVDKKPPAGQAGKDDLFDLSGESLGDIEAEIDLAMQDKLEHVGLTTKEEDMLLKGVPAEETPLVKDDLRPSIEEPVKVDEVLPPAFKPSAAQEAISVQEGRPKAGIPVDMPTEAILDAVISEFRKEMPALLKGIIAPVMKGLVQEIISSTREALPAIVEKVIQEEIERLKKI